MPYAIPLAQRIYPQRGITYSLRYILTVLYLRDSAYLGFTHEGIEVPIQDSHCTVEQMLANSEFADTNWTYVRETSEWIPVFKLARGETLEGLVTVEAELDYHTGAVVPGRFFAYPTHCPCEQQRADRDDSEKESFDDALDAMDGGIAAMSEENKKLRAQQ